MFAMSALVRILARVSFVTFFVEGIAILFLPAMVGDLASLLEQTSEHAYVVSQGAALLLIAASIYLSEVLFAGFLASLEPPPAGTQSRPESTNQPNELAASKLFAEFPSGDRARLVVESASGQQIRLVMETAVSETRVERQQGDDQIQGFTPGEFSRLALAVFGFLGSLYILVGENAALVAVVLVPPIYALVLSSVAVPIYWMVRRFI